MARGYLGKISAVISANNGSYVRALNDSAAKTKNFANTIQNDLKRASADASKSLNGILTPLQRIERAIQNAVSQRLSFRGFEGAIRTVRDLEKSLANLSDQEVRVVLKTTGAESIEQVKRAVSGLQQTDVDLFVNLVGAEQSLSKLQQLITQAKASGGQVLGDRVNVDIARAEQLEATLNGVGISLKRLQAAGEAVNTIRADAAATSFRALLSVSEEIGKPLAAAAQQFGTLSLEVQAQFIPALKRAQDGVEALESDISQKLPIAERRFRGVRTEAEQAAQAIARLSEASRLVASGATGNELGFVAPRVRGELQASAQTRNQVAESADPSRFRAEVQQLDRLAKRIETLNASVEQRRTLGLDTTDAERRLDSIIARSVRARQAIADALAGDSLGARSDRDPTGRTIQQRVRDIARLRDADEQRAAASPAAVRQREDADLAAIQRREQASLQLERQLTEAAQQRANAEINALIRREQVALRLERQLSDASQQRVDSEISALIRREQTALRLERQLADAAQQRQDAEIQAITRREQASLRLERQLAEAAQQREQAEINALIRREQAARRLEEQLGGTPQVGAATPLPPDRARGRILAEAGGELQSIRRQLAELPDVASTLGPEIDRLTTRFQNMGRAGIRFSADEARQLQREIRAASDALANRRGRADSFLSGAGGAGAAGLNLGIDERRLRGTAGEIEFLQDRLSRFTADARGPAVQALQRYREVVVAAFRNGSASTQAGARAIREARDEVVRLTAAIDGANPRRLGEQLRRAGDVSRGGFQNFQLAIQQAAFAVDDFFSVTGDISQRIRAVGNNISQLGFVLGGTQGLIIGIAASISAQLVAALIRWSNEGRTAEDQTKALNDALARQKSLVEELAQAFASLGDAIARRAFSGPAQEARAFRRELEEVRKKQKELRDQRAFSLDEGVQRARADVNVAQRELGKASTRDQAVAAQRRLDEARARLAQEEARVRNQPEPNPALTRERALNLFDQAADRNAARAAQAAGASGGGQAAVNAAFEQARRRGQQLLDQVADRTRGVNDPAALRGILRDEQRQAAGRGDNRLVAELEELINSLDTPVRRAADEFAVRLIESANRAAQGIELAQNRVAAAIQAGVPGALDLGFTLDKIAAEIDSAQQEIADAQRAFTESAQTPADAAERDRRVAAARDRLDRGEQDRRNARIAASEIDFRRVVDPQETFDAARGRIQQGLQGAGVASGALARRLRKIEAQRAQLLSVTPGLEGALQGEEFEAALKRQIEELDGQTRAVEVATIAVSRFAESINRAQQEVSGNVQSAQQRADEARRRDLRLGTSVTGEERQIAESELREQQDIQRRAQATFDSVRARMEENALDRAGGDEEDEFNRVFGRLREINQLVESGSLDSAARADIERERVRLEAQIADAVEKNPKVQAARDESTRAAERQDLARRGRELVLTPGERQARNLSEDLEALRIEFARQAEEGTGLIDQAGLLEAQKRQVEAAQRQIAPLAFQFSDEIANAVLQGPSRAALGATDASTTQGQAELNRLLRGDDAARDVNLVELQKQTDELKKLNEKLPFPVAEA